MKGLLVAEVDGIQLIGNPVARLPAHRVDNVVHQVETIGFAVRRRHHFDGRIRFIAGRHIHGVQVAVVSEHIDKALCSPGRGNHGGRGQGIVANKACALARLLWLV